MKLPRNQKEFALFLSIISILSVIIIAPFITCVEIGFSFVNWMSAYKTAPFIWIAVVILVLLTHGPATKLNSKLIKQEDSFYAHIIVETLCTVMMMSAVLTIVGTWIGMGQINIHPFETFIWKWPRNFGIALAVELLIAQPIARLVMLKVHQVKDAKSAIVEQ